MAIKSIILATDQGKNMKSSKIKVLHKILDKALINYPAQALAKMGSSEIGILVEGQSEAIKNVLDQNLTCTFLEATDITKVKKFIGHDGDVVVLSGDMPLIENLDLKRVVEFHQKFDYGTTVLSVELGNPEDYGKAYIFKAQVLKDALLKEDSFENIIKDLRKDGEIAVGDASHLLKISSRSQLAKCMQLMRRQINERHMENGVTIEDPNNTYIGQDVAIGYDTIIEPNCILRGQTVVGSDCILGCNTTIENSKISNGVKIKNSVICESFVDDHTHIGPFAYIRPQSKIGKHVRIGDFVEIKNSTIGDHTQISHLTYVGDADVGEYVNFGCGTVLVNYDSVDKHRSTIEDHAFIGCNTNLVSPVTIGKGAFTAAGSTITKDVPEESLGISRAKQVNKEGWVAYKYPKK